MICLSIDGLQAGMLGPYGNTWIHTPQLNRLAADAWVADQCYATNPEPHDVLEAIWRDAMLQTKKWILVTDDSLAHAHPQAGQFAERILLNMPDSVGSPVDDIADTQFAALCGKSAEFIQQLDASSSLWIHSRGMRGPWDAPLAFRNQYADEEDPTPPDFTTPPEQTLPDNYDPDVLLGITHAYAGQVSLIDACLGVLFDVVESLPCAEARQFTLVGVRGYPLGEHSRVGICDAALYREMVHVPLMIYRPGNTAWSDRSSQLLTHADLPALLRSEPLIGNVRDHLRFTSVKDRAIRTWAWYLRESGERDNLKRELYVKPDDIWEVNDVADRCPDIVNSLSELLAHHRPISSPLPEELCKPVD